MEAKAKESTEAHLVNGNGVGSNKSEGEARECSCGQPMLETLVKSFQEHVHLYEPKIGVYVDLSCWMCPSCGTAGPFFISERERQHFMAERNKREVQKQQPKKVVAVKPKFFSKQEPKRKHGL